MKKKILLLTLAFVFAFTSFGFAAVSGAKARPSSPPPRTEIFSPNTKYTK